MRERISHLAITMDPTGPKIEEASRGGFPFGRAPEHCSRWDRFGIEACSSDKILLGSLPRISEIIGFIGGGIRSN